MLEQRISAAEARRSRCRDPYLFADEATPSIQRMAAGTLRVVPGGHGPWLVDLPRAADLIETHLSGLLAARGVDSP